MIPSEKLFGSALPSLSFPAALGSGLLGVRKVAQSLYSKSGCPSEAIVWDWDKVLNPFLEAGPASPPIGN